MNDTMETPRALLSVNEPSYFNIAFESNPIGVQQETSFFVYRIRNTVTRNLYFGSTNNPRRRWSQHVRDLKNGRHANEYLRADAKNFGIESFEFRVLSRHVTAEAMRIREQLYITLFWGRVKCCNREMFVEMQNGPESEFVFTAEHQTFREQPGNLQSSITKEKGWGNYLSIHAASRDLAIPKAEISAALNDHSKNARGWIFSSLKVSRPHYRSGGSRASW